MVIRYCCILVRSENPRAVHMVNWFVREGHRDIALISWRPDGGFLNSPDKMVGYKLALEENGIELREELVGIVTQKMDILRFFREGSRPLLQKMLKLKNPPTAVVIDNCFISPPLLVSIGEDKGGASTVAEGC